MNKISRAISHKFLSELNNKHLDEVKDFFNYANCFYEDLKLIEKFYKDEFDAKSLISIDRYLISFNNVYKKIIEQIFDVSGKDFNTEYMQKCGRFDVNTLIDLSNKNKDNNKKFKLKFYDQNDFEQLQKLTNKIFMLEVMCSKYTKRLWNFTDKVDLKKGLFVKIITKENWRENKLTLSLKNYYNNRIGMSVSFVNEQKCKFFKEDQTEFLAGIVYKPKNIICGNYFDSYTSEFIDGVNPVDNVSFKFSNINKVYQENEKRKHEIYAFGTLTSTPLGVLCSDDCHNEVIIDKRNAKPVAVFYVNEQSLNYAKILAKEHKLPVVQIESLNKLNEYNVIRTKHILDEKIHF